MTSLGLRYIELRHNDFLGSEMTSALRKLDTGLYSYPEEGRPSVEEIRHSLNEAYILYAGLYLSQNGVLHHTIPKAFAEFYFDLKMLFTLMSKIALPFDKPNAVRLQVFHDMVPYLRESFEAHELYDRIWQRPPVGDKHMSLLSLLYRANDGVVSDLEIALMLSKVRHSHDFRMISELCLKLKEKLVGLTQRYNKGYRITQVMFSQRPTLGNFRLMKFMAMFRFMGKWEKYQVRKNFPNLHSDLDCMLVANKHIVDEATAQQQQITDFSPEDKDLIGLMSLLHGTDVVERLYSEGYEQRFAQHPMVMMFNNNSECYEFKAYLPREVFDHVGRGHSVYLFNNVQTCDSRGEATVSSMFHDAQQLANYLITRFAYSFPGANKFKLAFHGTSIGGMYATVTAHSVEKQHPTELMYYMLASKTFGSLYNMSWHRLSWFGGFLSRFYGVSVDLYHRYVELKMPKINVFEINDSVVPSYYSISGEVSLKYFNQTLKDLQSDFKELAEMYREIPKEGAISPIVTAFHSINSAGHLLSEPVRFVGKKWYANSQYLTTYLARMVAYGSMPPRFKPTEDYRPLRLPQLWKLLSECTFGGMSTFGRPERQYLKVPANIAALFNMFLNGEAAFGPKAKLHDRIEPPQTRPPVGSDGLQMGNIMDYNSYRIVWPNLPEGYNTKGTPSVYANELVKEDLKVFGIEDAHIDGVRLYAWMHLYNLLNTISLVHAVKSHSGTEPAVIAKVETFATGLLNHCFGVDGNEPKIEVSDEGELLTPMLNTEFFRVRYQAFGNILTTYTKHSIPLERPDLNLVASIVG
ncbi:alpha beta superfamily hydrolase [Babesia ovis]|uniref:Alpha beta superfamily hydrolase n=1 Tax=Babesia ovis TaxID=5869 RepID=A0A9W5TD64_BABOV|nr:alpha beta superfamily hydrolase [Babesia ovis]